MRNYRAHVGISNGTRAGDEMSISEMVAMLKDEDFRLLVELTQQGADFTDTGYAWRFSKVAERLMSDQRKLRKLRQDNKALRHALRK